MTRLAPPILMMLALPAAAQPMLSLPLAPDAGLTSLHYACDDGTPRSVTYVNSGDDSLALVTLAGQPRIFVNVIAASGARYVAGVFEWWSKGDRATLTDATSDADPVTCTTTP